MSVDTVLLRLGVFRALRRARAILSAEAAPSLRPFGLSLARYELLHLLMERRRQGWALADLARELDLHRTSVTATVEILQAQGFVEMCVDDEDKRRRVVGLTPRGMLLLTAATGSLHDRATGPDQLLRAAEPLEDLSEALRRAARLTS